MQASCRDLENLHYLDSWNKHCGGSWWQFTSRSLTLGDSTLLAYLSARMIWTSRLFGISLGTGLFSKSMNDMYEAWTGDRGSMREIMGDSAYDAAGYAVAGYGLFRPVSKIGPYGNPKRDFFVRDPNNYELAFYQYSSIEFLHMLISTSVTFKNDHDKYKEHIDISIDWARHLGRAKNLDDNR